MLFLEGLFPALLVHAMRKRETYKQAVAVHPLTTVLDPEDS